MFLAALLFGFATYAAHAQHIEVTSSPSTFTAAGQSISFTYTLYSDSSQIETLSIQTPTMLGLTPTCPPFSSPIAPGGTYVCTASYTTTAGDMTAGFILEQMSASGTRAGGFTWSADSSVYRVNRDGGGGTTTSVSASPSTATYGEAVTLSATVSPNGTGTPTGTVRFEVGPTGAPVVQQEVALSSGTASFTSTEIPAGTHDVRAIYLGDGDYSGSIGLGASLTINKANTTTTVTSSRNPVPEGVAVIFTATVNSSTGVVPSGNVTFDVGGLSVTEALDSAGKATYEITFASSGNKTVEASYAGNGNFNASNSTVLTQQVVSPPTITVSPTSLADGTVGVTYSATVTASGGRSPYSYSASGLPAGLSISPAGTISGTPDTAGDSTITVTATDIDGFTGSHTLDLSIAKGASATVLTASPAGASTVGDTVTLTATVSGGGATPSGNVVFTVGGGTPETVALDASGKAVLTTQFLEAGSFGITAQYAGDANYSVSNAAITGYDVSAIATTTTLSSSSNPSTVGEAVTFTATVTGGTGSLAPAGEVAFKIGAAAPVSVALGTDGKASFTTSSLTAGAHTVTATYAPSSEHQPSAATLNQSVDVIGTALSLASDLNPADAGEEVTFTVTVNRTPGVDVPTGTVQFSVDGTAAGAPVAVDANGEASYSRVFTAATSFAIQASYSGDANYGPAVATLTQLVDAPAIPRRGISLTGSSSFTAGAATATISASISGSRNPGRPMRRNGKPRRQATRSDMWIAAPMQHPMPRRTRSAISPSGPAAMSISPNPTVAASTSTAPPSGLAAASITVFRTASWRAWGSATAATRRRSATMAAKAAPIPGRWRPMAATARFHPFSSMA